MGEEGKIYCEECGKYVDDWRGHSDWHLSQLRRMRREVSKISCALCGEEVACYDFPAHVQRHLIEDKRAECADLLPREKEVQRFYDAYREGLEGIEAQLTMEDLRRDCFPADYTWWAKQPERVDVEDSLENKVKKLVGKILGK
jgi:hypothetical protein